MHTVTAAGEIKLLVEAPENIKNLDSINQIPNFQAANRLNAKWGNVIRIQNVYQAKVVKKLMLAREMVCNQLPNLIQPFNV